MAPHDQCLIFGRYTSKDFDLIMKEVIRVFLDEVIIYRIEVMLSIFKTEISHFLSLLLHIALLIFDKMQNFHRVISPIIFFALYYCDFGL
jgi:hypothetical protein